MYQIFWGEIRMKKKMTGIVIFLMLFMPMISIIKSTDLGSNKKISSLNNQYCSFIFQQFKHVLNTK